MENYIRRLLKGAERKQWWEIKSQMNKVIINPKENNVIIEKKIRIYYTAAICTMSTPAFISYRCCNKLVHMWWLKTSLIFFSYSSGCQESKISFTGLRWSCQLGWFLLEALREESIFLPFLASGGHLHFLACDPFLAITPISCFLPLIFLPPFYSILVLTDLQPTRIT